MSDRQETVIESAEPADAAMWADLEKEVLGDEDGGEVEAPAEGEPEAKAAEPEAPETEKKEASEKPAPLPYEELEKRHKQLQGALGEERNGRKQLAERVQQMQEVLRQVVAQRGQPQGQEQQPVKVPTIEEDPIGFFTHKLAEQERVIQQLTHGTRQTVEQIERQNAERQFWGAVSQSEQEMRAAAPDYDDAVSHLEAGRVRELNAMFPDNDPNVEAYVQKQGFQTAEDYRIAMLNNDRIAVARQALSMGVPPAKLYYSLALQRGYQKAATAAPQIKKPTAQSTPIQATKAGIQASKSLSGGGAGTSNTMTADDLAELYLEDPDRADKEFARMKKAGLLG